MISPANPIEKGVCISNCDSDARIRVVKVSAEWGSFGAGAIRGGDPRTRWCFDAECVPWSKGMVRIEKTATLLSGVRCLSKEGVYWMSRHRWKRLYLMRSGIQLILVEDVPESGGQNCIWAAGLVMGRYLEDIRIAASIRGRRVLELGAGCGLTSMVAAALGAEVYSTEQDSCLPYLQYNLALNPDITVNARRLHWTYGFNEERFDVILGCDITYDLSWIDGILQTFDKCLSESGLCYVCHDDDSCPMSPEAVKRFLGAAATNRFEVAEVDYSASIEPPFRSPTVRMWKLTRFRHADNM